MYKISNLLILLTIVSGQIVAQDLHFSQFDKSPLTLNPALTGNYKGDWRISGNYRSQWGSVANKPFTTYSFGFSKQEFYHTQQLNWGIVAIRDESFMNMNSTKVLGSFSYGRDFNKNFITLGLQLGFVNRQTKLSAYKYDSQFDLGGVEVFNPSFDNFETGSDAYSYFDINAGLLWKKRISENFTPEAGIGFSHLTQPHESFYGEDSEITQLGVKTTIHAGGEYKATELVSLNPLLLYSEQKGATNWLTGGTVELKLLHETFKSIYGGTLFRYGWEENYDASIWIIGTKFNNFDLGFSYDFNVSSLSEATNYQGAFEITLIYTTSSTKPDKIQIPCDRY